VVQPAHSGVVPLLKPGRARHPHLADIGGRIERCHHHRHLCPLARSALVERLASPYLVAAQATPIVVCL
jgi:hypothetical protein